MVFKQSLMENDSILLHANANNWQEAIKLGTDMLVKTRAISPTYYDAIIHCVKTMGPYIIIAPHFAMPHARPEDGVNRTAFALVTLQNPVFFDGESEPVDILITLAGSTSDEHIAGLMEVMQILDDQSHEDGINLDRLRLCQTKHDVYCAIDHVLMGS